MKEKVEIKYVDMLARVHSPAKNYYQDLQRIFASVEDYMKLTQGKQAFEMAMAWTDPEKTPHSPQKVFQDNFTTAYEYLEKHRARTSYIVAAELAAANDSMKSDKTNEAKTPDLTNAEYKKVRQIWDDMLASVRSCNDARASESPKPESVSGQQRKAELFATIKGMPEMDFGRFKFDGPDME